MKTPLLLVALLLAAPATARAGTLTVTSSADDGAGSLRQAVADAGSGDTIDVGARDIVLTSGELDIDSGKALTIIGAGARATSVSGNHASRILDTNAPLTLSGLTLRDGKDIIGGAIETGGPLTLTEVALRDNDASGNRGGAVDASGAAVTITRSLFAGNRGSYGGAVHFSANGPVTITDSTFVGNTATASGGGIYTGTAAVGISLTLLNDTFTGNRAPDGFGGAFSVGTDDTVRYRNSVFADNLGHCYEAGGGAAVSDGQNVFDGTPDFDCHVGDADQTVPDARVTPLADNGGPTDTVRPLATSPALDFADAPFCPSTDARGIARPAGAGCDAGAVELSPPAVKTGFPTDVTTSGATLHGTVDGHGLPTAAHFEWGPTEDYGNTPPDGVDAPLSGLPAGTTFHYRLIATSVDGTTAGADATFTTASTPAPAPQPTVTRACTVPKLRGLKLAKAKRKLRAAGCALGKVKRVRSRHVKRRRVIRASSTEPVRLVVSRGRPRK